MSMLSWVIFIALGVFSYTLFAFLIYLLTMFEIELYKNMPEYIEKFKFFIKYVEEERQKLMKEKIN